MRDPYAILGVSNSADPQTLRRAYKKLAVQFHPDRNADPQAAARFKEVAEAYAVLTNERERKRYARRRHREHAERQQQRQRTAEAARQRAASRQSAAAAAAEKAFRDYARQVHERRTRRRPVSSMSSGRGRQDPGRSTDDWTHRLGALAAVSLMIVYVWRSFQGLPLQPWLRGGLFLTHPPYSPIWITLCLSLLMIVKPRWFLIPILIDGVRDVRLAGWAMILCFPFVSAGGTLGIFQ